MVREKVEQMQVRVKEKEEQDLIVDLASRLMWSPTAKMKARRQSNKHKT